MLKREGLVHRAGRAEPKLALDLADDVGAAQYRPRRVYRGIDALRSDDALIAQHLGVF